MGVCSSAHTVAQTVSDDDRQKMVREAGNCAKQFFADLNLITTGDENLRKYRDEGINEAINNYFYSPSVHLYNDIAQEKEKEIDSLRIREYLEKAYAWYPKGVVFDCSFNVRPPCPQTETHDEMRFFVVKVETAKTLQGIYKFNNQLHTNTDSLDIYIHFAIKQDRPKLVLDGAKIYRITKHKKQDCPIRELNDEEKNIFQLPDDEIERQWLKARAKHFIEDYAVTLNIIGNKYINDRFKTTDYFESENTNVYNDLLPQTRIPAFKAEEYLKGIENWFQEGIEFKYKNVRSITVNADFDHVLVEVHADRILKSAGVGRNEKNRQRLSFLVKFPVVTGVQAGDDRKVVGLERSTPRISNISAVPPRINPRYYWTLGGQMFSSHYFGDIAPSSRVFSTDLSRTKPSFGVYIMRKLSHHWFAKFNFLATTLSGDDFTSADFTDNLDQYRAMRNLHFRNRIREYSLSAVYELYPNKGKFYARRFFSPYISFGIGTFRNNPEARKPINEGNAWTELRLLGTEGQGREGYRKIYALWQPVVPLSIGVRYKINRRIDFSFEVAGRITFTDYLDDISGAYPDYADFGNDENARMAMLMSNRSLEKVNAFNQKSREEAIKSFVDRGGQILSYKDRNGNTYTTMNGYGRKDEKRGTNTNRDYYLFTGFQLHYLLNVGSGQTGQKSTKSGFKHTFGQ